MQDKTTILFFDDFYLDRWENLRRHVGRPQLVSEATFEDPDGNIIQMLQQPISRKAS